MAGITAENVTKSFEQNSGELLHVLDDVSITVEEGEFLSILGPSGCGKSTFLRAVAGLATPDGGTIQMDKENPKTGFVFQDSTLLDWKTVANNVRLGLRGMGVPKAEHEERIDRVLESVGLLDFKDQYPPSLSGGMQQRVGLARALAIGPDILLMDEPFGSLDELTARKLREDLLDIYRDEGVTVLFVTHNIQESVYLADRVAIFSDKPAKITKVIDVDIDRPREPGDTQIPIYEEEILEIMGLV